MEDIFRAQKKSFRNNPYPSAKERINHLERLKPALLNNISMLTEAVNKDFGSRSYDETKLAEILTSLEGLKYYVKNMRKLMQPLKRKTGILHFPSVARVVYQPLGVVGVISPWNYPIFLAMGPLLGALAAGNRVIIKMSEYTPHTATAFKRIIAEAFCEDHVAIITGDADVGVAFSKLPFDHIIFTGSTSVGRHVMRAASENLTPVTLELGGKSPVIVSDHVSMSDVAERVAFGKCINAGQTCIAPDYLLCPTNRVDEFVTEFSACVSKMYPNMLNNPDFTSVINKRQNSRLKEYLDDAKDKGARIIEINPANENFEKTNKIPITMVLNVNDEMKIMQDEIFGPLLCIVPYDGLDKALEFVNDRPRPLALYYFDYNKSRCEKVLKESHSGGVCLNDTITHVSVDDMPFGGVGDSGMGSYHGPEGFKTFSHTKSVFEKGKINGTKYIFPPFGGVVHELLYKKFLK